MKTHKNVVNIWNEGINTKQQHPGVHNDFTHLYTVDKGEILQFM